MCQQCGTEFDGYKNQLYCSRECYKAANRDREQSIRDAARALGRACVVCGKMFYPRHLGKQTCSDECARKLYLDRKSGVGNHVRIGSMMACARCGQMFTVHTPTAKYCSAACYKAANRETQRLRYQADRPMQQRRKGKPALSLEQIVKEAARQGMSYGQYVARMEGGML